jgi:bifunctional N-acetylglucosamine-1-phosphate-uridyltransferase/glucosamine-1-phosphate-acetyltransferase GlmU-like protein
MKRIALSAIALPILVGFAFAQASAQETGQVLTDQQQAVLAADGQALDSAFQSVRAAVQHLLADQTAGTADAVSADTDALTQARAAATAAREQFLADKQAFGLSAN